MASDPGQLYRIEVTASTPGANPDRFAGLRLSSNQSLLGKTHCHIRTAGNSYEKFT
jgi:hypothetical protein